MIGDIIAGLAVFLLVPILLIIGHGIGF